MKAKFVGILAGSLMAVSALGATSASAATEFGDSCVANETTTAPGVTYFAFGAAGDPLPLTAPTSGVITRWKIASSVPTSTSEAVKVLRQNGAKTVFIVGESASATVNSGSNSFETRIPVQAGDRLGLSSSSLLLYCLDPSGGLNSLGAFIGGGPGSTAEVIPLTAEARFPISALIEPDADNDGYGDETQDKCPQVAAVQTACPAVVLSTSASAKKGLATVLVTANSQAAVTVGGTAKLGKGKTATLSGGTQVVQPGVIAKFTLLFGKKLKEKLKQLTPKQSLTLNVSASAPNVVGAPSISSLKVKLKGQKKARHKGK